MCTQPRFVLPLITLLLVSVSLCAQPFKKALGFRLGYPISVSYKQFVSPKNAFEVYAGSRGYRDYRGLSLQAAYQIHQSITEINGLKFYYGGGVGVHFWNYNDRNRNRDYRGDVTTSITGYLGLQYVFPDIPISLTLDWVPTFFVGGRGDSRFQRFGSDYGGLGIRYCFGG